MTVSEALARAASMIGKKTKYRLGRGGTKPTAPTPADSAGQCDCSGFVCWCLGLSRKTTHPAYLKQNGGWINTSAIVFDAKNPVGFFSRLAAPVPGALWVYPWSGGRPGHVAIIESVSKAGCSIIHCSSGNSRRGDAIARTSAAMFEKNPAALIAWYAGFDATVAPSADGVLDEILAL
jgi:hypothetical protein